MTRLQTAKHRLTVSMEKLVYGGDALGRVDGQVLLAPFALPGEEIETEAEPGKGRVLRGSNSKVLSASEHRVTPFCEYFGRCGGCQYQHADYEYQLQQKVEILRETLARLGSFTVPVEIGTVSGEPKHYRNRIQLHFERGKVGYRVADSHELCAITHCPISSPKLNEAIAVLRDMAKRPDWPKFLSSLEIFTNETDVQLHIRDTTRPIAARFFAACAEKLSGYVPDVLRYEAAGYQFQVSRGTFFQVNRFLVDALVKEVLQDYAGAAALDLYAGAGLFSLPLSERFAAVTAVERGGSAFRDLQTNAGKRPNITTARAATDQYLQQLDMAPDLAIADPPRTGLGPEASQELLRLQVPQLVIVSCDPATLARDLKTISTRYELRRMTLVDLFPQTYHFETVAHLELKR
jgi:23S rRNA (uracil1939-C5)-methyltransferase